MRFNIYNSSESKIKLFHSTNTPGPRKMRAHHHTEFEISSCISGSGVYSVDGNKYFFKAGDIFVFSCDEIHCITQIDGVENLELINIQFEPRFLWSSSGLADYNLLKIFFHRNSNFQNRFEGSLPATKNIFSMIYDMEKEFSSKKYEFELMVKIYLIDILISFMRDFDYVDFTDNLSRYEETLRQLEKAINYIDLHLEDDLTLDEIAAISAMSRAYFCTLFRKFNGISPWDYITIKRVEKAIGILKSSSDTKLGVASMCGFNSSSNFYKAFKKVTGKTPSDYTKQDL
ncbi:MAG: AraC family transcriptional regulator [Bacillota bacterium]|nr:AraC family transcriptional regulator [Bacillota bacterium]